MIYLYKITNTINDKVYIGQSNKETERWRQHKYFGRNPEWTKQYIHQSMNKYGVENFIYEIIAMSKTTEDADEAEIQLIDQYKSRDKKFGYNVASGGGAGWNRGLPKELQPMFGKKQSEYFIKRIKEVNSKKKGPHSQEHKMKISQSLKGTRSGKDNPMYGSSGDKNPNSKFSWELINKIRNEYENSNISQKDLSIKYNVSYANTNAILNYKIWKND